MLHLISGSKEQRDSVFYKPLNLALHCICAPAHQANCKAAAGQPDRPLCTLPTAPQVDFQVDFTRQNPSRAGIKRERKVLKTDQKAGNNAQ